MKNEPIAILEVEKKWRQTRRMARPAAKRAKGFLPPDSGSSRPNFLQALPSGTEALLLRQKSRIRAVQTQRNRYRDYAILASGTSAAVTSALSCTCSLRNRIQRRANAQKSNPAIATGSGISAALSAARAARAVACGPYCSSAKLKYAGFFSGVFQPTRAGMKVVAGRSTCLSNCLTVG